MRLVPVLGVASLVVAAAMVLHSANTFGVDDPYFKWGVALLVLPPAVVGLLTLAPWRAARTVGGSLALLIGIWLVITSLANAGGALLAGPGQADLAAVLATDAVAALVACLYLLIFWTTVIRDRVGTTTVDPHGTSRA